MYKYWRKLEAADTLKYRWADMVEPTAVRAIARTKKDLSHYAVFNYDKKAITAEFALESLTGKAAQVHFSMSPENKSETSLFLADSVADMILNTWIGQDRKPYLHTMFGITPMSNRPARLFICKSGFKKFGILPDGCSYLGNIDDALITIRTRH